MAREVKHVGERAFGDMLLWTDVLSTGRLASGMARAASTSGQMDDDLP
jgi:hypothetical protein